MSLALIVYWNTNSESVENPIVGAFNTISSVPGFATSISGNSSVRDRVNTSSID